jgi:acid stress-induced BolA-like protein IbaG/YrbA
VELSEISDLVQKALPDALVLVDGEGCSFSVVVVSNEFEGLSLVRRQQQVLDAVKDPLATGALHAITVKAHTPAEWEVRQQKVHGA